MTIVSLGIFSRRSYHLDHPVKGAYALRYGPKVVCVCGGSSILVVVLVPGLVKGRVRTSTSQLQCGSKPIRIRYQQVAPSLPAPSRVGRVPLHMQIHANVGVVWWDVSSLQRQLKKMLRSPHAYGITCTLPLEAEDWCLAGLSSDLSCVLYVHI